jgi:deoxyribonuclease-4
VFSDNPAAWRRKPEPPADLETFRDRLRGAGMPLAIHAPYLVNLAGPDEAFWTRSVETMAHELRVGESYGAAFVNVHIGSHVGAGLDVGLERLGAAVARVLDEVPASPSGSTLVLENGAGARNGIGNTVEELEQVLAAVESAGADTSRVAFCLDTAHLWGAGIDLADPDVLDALLADLDRRLGPERLAMLHLNDSRAGLASHLDRHEHIAAGGIGVRGMHALLTHPRLRDVPMFLETPGVDEGYDAVNIDRVRTLLADGSPPPLPTEAFDLKPRRRKRARPRTSRASEGTGDQR